MSSASNFRGKNPQETRKNESNHSGRGKWEETGLEAPREFRNLLLHRVM
jgi:hypothetical protein